MYTCTFHNKIAVNCKQAVDHDSESLTFTGHISCSPQTQCEHENGACSSDWLTKFKVDKHAETSLSHSSGWNSRVHVTWWLIYQSSTAKWCHHPIQHSQYSQDPRTVLLLEQEGIILGDESANYVRVVRDIHHCSYNLEWLQSSCSAVSKLNLSILIYGIPMHYQWLNALLWLNRPISNLPSILVYRCSVLCEQACTCTCT